MPLFEDLIKKLQPESWSTQDYSSKKFVRIPVDVNGMEVLQLIMEFKEHIPRSYEVVAVERIQAPFLYCRFQLRLRYLADHCHYSPEINRRYFFLASESKINELIEYNCDTRRYTVPLTASSLDLYSYTEYFAISLNALGYYPYEEKKRDSDQYPEYLIKFKKKSTESKNDNLSSLFEGLCLK